MRSSTPGKRLVIAFLALAVLLLGGAGLAWTSLAGAQWYPPLHISERGPEAWRRASEDLVSQAARRGYTVEWLEAGTCFVLKRSHPLKGAWWERNLTDDWAEGALDLADLYQAAADFPAVEIGCYRVDEEVQIYIMPSAATDSRMYASLFEEELLEALHEQR